MKNEQIYIEVIDVLRSLGVIIQEYNDDIDLTEYALDSLSYISFIVELEKKYSIMIPDDFLVIENMKSLKGFCEMLVQLIDNSTNHI